ncbi:hypothetical protein BC941DRAFT_455809 [Chlamydoabsidia padenii]|nr:hypothetical protein BC941DRAFT_455809 [Chlamydoabsidia padenii]
MRSSFIDVDGAVSYGGNDYDLFVKEFQGQVCYYEQDLHYRTLTTKQTLQFALRTKTPGKRLPEESKTDFVNKILYLLGNTLGLTKQMNTMVENAFVRGLPGGERQRLSIAEQMTTYSSINCWDCYTRGLDAASALDYVRSLRIMTDVFHKTTVATLYQASNSIFNEFDKVLLLDEGQCIYFGPVGEARQYFEDLAFYCPPRLQSSGTQQFRQTADQGHLKRASRSAPYTASFYQQVKAFTIRQYHLLIMDREDLLSHYVLLFEICSYFIMGMNLSAGRFFTYFIVMFFINMSTISFFRFWGAISPSFFVATQLSSVIIITFYNYTGYIVSYEEMHPWLFWIYRMNPLAYGTKTLMVKEMDGSVYSCEGPERITGYCEQMDVHQPAVTVREALRFSAYLRQPADVPRQEKDDYVETILQLLEMEDIADAQIGEVESGFGISVEERKRLTIGMELVGKPQLLFLDEPTSGLDAQSSSNIIRFIRKLADAGWPVLCTIHQPSAILFDHFDHLLLLVRGGRTAYYGPIGTDARVMIDYFEQNGGPVCGSDANPAEYILEVVGAGTAGKVTKDWATVWAESKQAKELEEELEQIHQTVDLNPTREANTYATSLWTQFVLIHKRMALSYWRSPEYNGDRFINIMLIALITGFTYWKLGHSTSDLQNKIFALYTTFVILAQPKFMTERIYFRREYASRYYSWFPWQSLRSWLKYLINISEAVSFFYLNLSAIVTWAVTLGYIMGSLTESFKTASVLIPLVMSILMLFSGLMQPPMAMPKFWSAWMYWANPFHYFLEGMTVNELENMTVECTDNDLIRFTRPPGQTCE